MTGPRTSSALTDLWQRLVTDSAARARAIGGVAIALAVCIVVIPSLTSAMSSSADAAGYDDPVPSIDFQDILGHRQAIPPCSSGQPQSCIDRRGTGQRVLVIGDSIAQQFIPLWRALAVKHDWTLAMNIYGGCSWQIGLAPRPDVSITDQRECQARRDPWYQTALSSLRPDVIILVQLQRDEPRFDPVLRPKDPALGALSLPERNAVTISGTLDLFARKVPQARIVLVEPLPIAPKPGPTTCLKTAGRLGDCAFVPTTSPPTELTLRALAGERPAVTTLDVDRLVCPDTALCMPIVDGVVVWRDDGHLSHHFVDHMVEPFDRALVDTGAIRVS